MFAGLLKSKFYCKCKSDIARTRTRIEMIKKKRNAVQKYLRNDVALLLKNKLDDKAYGRAEGLLTELNQSSCFDMIEQFCAQTANNLRAMDKQMDCPKDCREDVSSLMFAAARFAELPELTRLRSMFSERYTNTLEFQVNKQFMEKLKSGKPSKEMKLQLLQDIAAEFGIEWNSKALESKMYHEPVCRKDLAGDEFRVKVYVSCDSTSKLVLMDEFKGGIEYTENYQRKSTSPDGKDGQKYITEDSLEGRTENFVLRKDVLIKGIRMDSIERNEKLNKLEARDPDEENEEEKTLKYRSIPPPYNKSNANASKVSVLRDDTREEKLEPIQAENRASSEKIPNRDDVEDKSKQVPGSVSEKEAKTPPAEATSIHHERRKSKDKNKRRAIEQGFRVLKFLDRDSSPNRQDDEEKMMDKLLLHYSRKTTQGESDIKFPPNQAQKDTTNRVTKNRSRHGPKIPNRATSLPGTPYGPVEDNQSRRFTRASSFQPEMLNGKGHVHPKLPDYDEFVARLASLRGNK